ncbi:HpcH/HpaI aldolase/citrate lyase family protein [Mycolicibacterium sp. F2034L]|uniref:HpcH/HpaI aldolase family protein n=1 Tax=Mycolicibacterium sp. F2034L TaxID=2926422 RepID=UPI001FF22F55|nr:aldolase/citrate lyase family protein [Mycolicibacterium sp. F2034L]MCK0173821.1 aldolase/citrate lyase family protein [Mycolicibacterium sp. F2034L]
MSDPVTPPKSPVRRALTEHAVTTGPWITLTDPHAVEALAKLDLDHLVIDCQHGSADLGSVLPLLRAAAVHDMPVLIRVPANEPWQLMRALDLGAAGVIVPMVNSAAEAAAAATAMRYPPHGERSYGPVRPSPGDGFTADDGPVLLVMIETARGLADVDAIAATPGVDGLFVGPIDLALGIGAVRDGKVLMGIGADETMAAVETIAAAARAHGKVLAGAVFTPEHARAMTRAGVRLQVYGSDRQWMTAGAKAARALTDELSAEVTS